MILGLALFQETSIFPIKIVGRYADPAFRATYPARVLKMIGKLYDFDLSGAEQVAQNYLLIKNNCFNGKSM